MMEIEVRELSLREMSAGHDNDPGVSVSAQGVMILLCPLAFLGEIGTEMSVDAELQSE